MAEANGNSSGDVAVNAGNRRTAVAALLSGALVWGLIWYPYRVLRDLGVDGIAATSLTYGVALVGTVVSAVVLLGLGF